MTEDHQYLTFPSSSYYSRLQYLTNVFKNTGDGYQMIESNGEFKREYERRVYHLSFGYGTKLLAASTDKGLDLYSNFDEGNATSDQTASPSLIHLSNVPAGTREMAPACSLRALCRATSSPAVHAWPALRPGDIVAANPSERGDRTK